MISALNLSVDTDADADDGMDWDADDDARTPMTPAGHSVFAFHQPPPRRTPPRPSSRPTPPHPSPIATPPRSRDRRHRRPRDRPSAPVAATTPRSFRDDSRAERATHISMDDVAVAVAAAATPPSSHAASPSSARSPVRTVAEVAETSSDMFTLSDEPADEPGDDDGRSSRRRRASDASASSDENFDEHLDEDFPTTGTSPSRSTFAARARWISNVEVFSARV